MSLQKNLTLRDYQINAVNSFWKYFETKNGNPIIAMPTGTGKSVVIAAIIESILKEYPKTKILILTHVKELISQNHLKLLQYWPSAPAGIFSAGLKKKETNRQIIFAGIASIAKNLEKFKSVNLIFIDECHLVNTENNTLYKRCIDYFSILNPNIKVIGFSATPWRLKSGLLTSGGIFTDFCFDNTKQESFNKLIEDGYLCPLIPMRTDEAMDVSNVKIQGGDFIQHQLQQAVDREEITQNAVKEFIKNADDRKHWLIFSTGIAHSENIKNAFYQEGYYLEVLHSKMPDSKRDSIIAKFKSGKIRGVINTGILTTGFDFPAIDCIGIFRPTASAALWVQMLGRGTRPFEGKENCLVLDFAENTLRLGPINDPIIPKKSDKKKGGIAPVKICEKCNCYNHATAKICINCGFEFKFHSKLFETASKRDLIAKEKPIVNEFPVEHVYFYEHKKEGREPILKVQYFCGLRRFTEYFFPFSQKKSRAFENLKSIKGLMHYEKIADVISAMGAGPKLEKIRVWENTKFPQVLAYKYENMEWLKR